MRLNLWGWENRFFNKSETEKMYLDYFVTHFDTTKLEIYDIDKTYGASIRFKYIQYELNTNGDGI